MALNNKPNILMLSWSSYEMVVISVNKW